MKFQNSHDSRKFKLPFPSKRKKTFPSASLLSELLCLYNYRLKVSLRYENTITENQKRFFSLMNMYEGKKSDLNKSEK